MRDINQLYGTDTPLGREMLNAVMARYLLDILPDATISELATPSRPNTERKPFREKGRRLAAPPSLG